MRSLLVWSLSAGLLVCFAGLTACRMVAAEKPSPTPDAGDAAAEKSSVGKDSAVGRRIPNTVLDDAAGTPVGLYDFRDARLIVVTFLSTSCPISNRYLPILNDLSAKYGGRQVQFVAINSHAGDSAEEIAQHAREYGVTFPVLRDPQQVAADVFGASRTCETFILDSYRTVRYQGRIDDRFQYNAQRDEPSRHDLACALDELLAGEKVSVAKTDVAGCKLTHTRRAPEKGAITWSGQVAKILQERCEGCHHPHTAAPFSLQTYADAVNWAEMIREVVEQRRMPPWHADPRYGEFHDQRRLSQQELDTLIAWIDDGLPEGDPAQAPPVREYVDGWRIGEPDAVFELPEEVTIPATGVVPYLYFETPTNFTEDVWLEAAEARPGNRRAVHHIILYYRLPGQKGKRDFRDNWIDGSAPGNTPLMYPAGIGRKIPAGATLVWEMHYTATGKEEKDRSQYGLKFCKTKPERETLMLAVMNNKLDIPPGASNHKVVSKLKLPFSADVLSFAPHMHLRGKDFDYKAIFPDGRSEILMSMPQYDFNWQTGYGVKQPYRLPKGTVIECTAHFDNSADNPNNPDPTKSVRWGDQTWEEMMIGFMDVVPAE